MSNVRNMNRMSKHELLKEIHRLENEYEDWFNLEDAIDVFEYRFGKYHKKV